MRPARITPATQTSEATRKGPQLVPPRATPARAAETAETWDPHPLATVLVVGMIALIGATTFVGSIATALLLRNTGVNWMFERF